MLQLCRRAKHLLSEIVPEIVRAHIAETDFYRARVPAHSFGESTRVSMYLFDDAPDWNRFEFPYQSSVKGSPRPEASKAGDQNVAHNAVMVPAPGVPA